MPTGIVDAFAKIAAASGGSGGLRSFCQIVADELVPLVSGLYGFVCTERHDSEDLDVLAARGLDPTTFRRLEQRAGRSSLTRVFDINDRVDLLLNDEPTLEFLPRKGVPELVCVPLRMHATPTGLLAVAIDKQKTKRTAEFIRILEIAASMIAAEMRSQELTSRRVRVLDEQHRTSRIELLETFDMSNLVGNSAAFRAAADRIRQVSRSASPVLLRGETGTGKAFAAGVIHFNSLRAKRPFVKFSPAGKTDLILEHELLGHGDSVGKLDEADGGTLFIDEIAELPVSLQIALVGVLEERQFVRPGTGGVIPANIRFIAASRSDLEADVLDGSFRDDLYYRLNSFTIFLPPLRDRRSDILLLAEHFVERLSNANGKRITRIATSAIDMLAMYHFPGNVRELENVIEWAVAACDGGVIHARHLPPTIQTAEQTGTANDQTLDAAVKAFERDLISDALKSSRGNIAKAARSLDSTERIIGYKVKHHGIDTSRFK